MAIIGRVLAAICLFSLTLMAQSQGRATSSGSSDSRSSGSSGVGTAASTSSSSARETSYDSSPSRFSGSSTSGIGGGIGGGTAVPSLRGTSFVSYDLYYGWQNLMFDLRRLNMGMYFDNQRYLRNVEPLLTPQIATLAARMPLFWSSQLLLVIDELTAQLADLKAGKAVDRRAIEANTRQLCILAKAIRTNSSLDFIDLRPNKDLLKGTGAEKLGFEALDRLREIALDLNTQLKGMAQQSPTISVEYLTKPSFVSLAKGIEKLSQVIEKSARQL